MKALASALAVSLVAAAQLTAQTSDVLGRVISARLEGVSVPAAIDELARKARARVSYSRDLLDPDRRVTLNARAITLGAALQQVVAPDGLEITLQPSGLIVIEPAPRSTEQRVGGTVRDASSGAPVSGAVVSVGGRASTTDAAGHFSFAAMLAPGRRALVRRLGYLPAVATLDGARPADIALQPAPILVDRVVVTGSEAGSSARALPMAITVIPGAQLRSFAGAGIADVFRGLVPGTHAWDDGPATPSLRFGSIRGASSFSINYFKTYIDGVEVAAPFLALALDPESIDHVEVIRGPQSAALYGSDANSGVVHVVTRRGAAARGPRVLAHALRGIMDSRLATSSVPTREIGARFGLRGRGVSIDAGALDGRIGEFIPGGSARTSSYDVSFRAATGIFVAELGARSSSRSGNDALVALLREKNIPLRHISDSVARSEHQNLGGTLTLNPAAWITLRATGGRDRTELDAPPDPIPFLSSADSFLVASRGTSVRNSARAAAEVRLRAGRRISAVVTAGADRSRLFREGIQPKTATAAESRSESRQSASGFFGQTVVAFGETIFLTAGLRREENSSFGDRYGATRLPLLGVAVAREFGPATVKLRGARGRGIRPPPPGAETGYRLSAELLQRASLELAPEEQRGHEIGADIYVGRARAHVTRYRQTADGLIQQVLVDANSKPRVVQQQNVGAIGNRGWELEIAASAGPASLAANYSRTESRVEAIAQRYTGTLRAGDRMLEVPSSMAGGRGSLTAGRVSLAFSVSRVGDWANYDWLALYGTALRRETPRGPPRTYIITYPAFTRFDAAVSVRAGPSELSFSARNLTNVQRGARDNLRVSTGRVVSLAITAPR